jgi:hypothetical protein
MLQEKCELIKIQLLSAYLLVFAEIISSTLKMEAICSPETSVTTQQTTRRHIPEDDTLHLTLMFTALQVCER